MSSYRLFPEYVVNKALHQLELNLNNYKRAVTQIATGLRIVRAADDSSDLMISDWAKQFHETLTPAIKNITKGIEILRTTDDALTQIYNIALKIKELVIEANGKSEEERKTIQGQINELTKTIKAIIEKTELDGFNLLKGDYYIVHYGSDKDKYLVINANSALQNSLYLIAHAGSKETDPVSLGFDNLIKTQPSSGSSENTGGTNKATPIAGSGDATFLNPFTVTFKDLTLILGAFGIADLYLWQIQISLPSVYTMVTQLSPLDFNVTLDDYTIQITNPEENDVAFVRIVYNPTGEAVKGTVKYGEGGTLYYYPAGTDPKIYEYDSIDKKSYEVNIASVNTYQIQVASSEDTLQKSIKNIETYIAKLDIVRGYYGSIENKLLNIEKANLMLRDNVKAAENTVRGADLASSYGQLIMERFKSETAGFIIAQAFQVPQLLLRILR